jgi:hypothetical protein
MGTATNKKRPPVKAAEVMGGNARKSGNDRSRMSVMTPQRTKNKGVSSHLRHEGCETIACVI